MANNFDLDEIKALVELLRENEVSEFKLERSGDRIWLRRGEIQQVVVASQPMAVSAAMPQAAVAAPQAVAVAPAVAAAAVSVSVKEVRSPMVGTFYRRPAVDAEPYVQVGDLVKKGSVLCIVEAMKLMNEIESDVAGKVVEVCLEDGQMAEYGEVLFRIDTAV